MKIGVLSDTHLSRPDNRLDFILDEIFADMDIILHAGDIVSGMVLGRLEAKGVVAVCGNMDDYAIIDSLPNKRIVKVENKRIGLMHGWGSKTGLAERVITQFETAPDLIIHGHSHVPFWGEIAGVQVFNPGSASQNRYYGCPTVGILTLMNGNFNAEFIDLKGEMSR